MDTRSCVAVLFTLSISAVASFAQVDTGMLSGHVYDPSNAPVSGASVALRNVGTNYSLTRTTNEAGLYVSPPLPSGQYEIQITQTGFRPAAKSVELHISERLLLDFTLELGAVTETLTVQGVGSVLQTETSTLSTLRTEREIKSLPINTRNFASLILFTAGVAPAQDQINSLALSAQRGTTSSSVNGVSWSDNNFLLDGINDNGNHQGWGLMIHPEFEAIDQFRVETSVPDARFSRSGATVNVGYKSGTAELHGTLFEFLRNSKLDARNFFATSAAKPPLTRNFFGGTFGGPVGGKKARTFFFLSYEGERTRQGVTNTSTVPTPKMRNGDFTELLAEARPTTIYDPLTTRANPSGAGLVRTPFNSNTIPTSYFNKAGKGVTDLFPQPNRPGLASNFSVAYSNRQNMDQGTAKIDHDFSSGSRGFFRITRGSSYFVNSRPLGPVATPFVAVSIPATQAVLSYTHLISPSTINQARFAVSSQPLVSEEQTGGQNTSEMLGIPNVNVDRLTSGLSRIDVPGLTSMGANDNRPAVIKMHNFQFNDNFDTVRGGHTLKLGFDVIRRRTNAYQAQWNRGQFSFSTNYTANPASRPNTGFGAADLLLGKPASILLNGLEGTRGLRQTDWGYYFQDDWKLMRKLTLNLGLRYEYYQGYPQYEVRDRMMQFDVASGQPVQINSGKYPWRAGIPPDRNNLAPRVGLALQINDATVVRAAFGVYYVATTIAIAHTLSSNPPYFLNSTVSNDEGNFAGARALTDGPLRTAERGAPGQNYRGISLDFGNPYVQQWNLALQRRLPLGHQLTMAYVGTKGTGVISQQDINQARPGDGAVAARRRWPERGSILIRQNLSHLVYHGLQATVVRRFANGLQYQAAYTWSHVIDNEDKGGEGAMGPIPFDQYWRLRSNGDTDLRQMMRVTFGYELPVGRGKPHLPSANKVVNGVIGGWEVNGVLSLSAGTPLSAGAGSNSLNNGSGTYADRLRDGNLPVGQRSVDRWFDIDAFAIPGFRQWGNSGRNVLYGPGTKQFDMSLFKNFAVAEKKHIQFRAEFFNVSNTPQFNNPNASIGTANAGRISSAGAEARLQRTQREIQLALKFTF